MNRIIEIIPTLYWASLGFYTVHRVTMPTTITATDEDNIYIIKLDRIINTLDSKLK